MRAQDVMSSPAVTLHPERSVRDAAKVLSSNGFTAAPVVDGNGRLLGMVTEADLVGDRILPDGRGRIWREAETSADPRASKPAATVGQVMTRPAVSVTPDADVRDVARMMLADQVRSIPVVDAMGVVGVVTRRDLLKLVARDDMSIAAAVRSHLAAYRGSDYWTVSVHDGAVAIVDDLDSATDRHVARVIAEAVAGVSSVEVSVRRHEPAR
jgi:CBS domain-containing protein